VQAGGHDEILRAYPYSWGRGHRRGAEICRSLAEDETIENRAFRRPSTVCSVSTDEAQKRRPMHAVRELELRVGRSQESGS